MSVRRSLHRLLSPIIYRDGTAVVPAGVAPEWAERQFLRRLLKALQVDCVIDVGANVGQYARILRLVGFVGTILSFEPSPDPFRELSRRSANDANWHVFNCALGAAAGNARLNVMKSSVFNSFREPSSRETDFAEPYNQVVEQIDVPVKRLDDLFPALRAVHSFKRPFLKTDTQGFDIEVFRGAAGVQSDLVGIQCELAVKPLYEGVIPWRDAMDEYAASGFRLAGIFNALPREMTLYECDCFFVREGAPPLVPK